MTAAVQAGSTGDVLEPLRLAFEALDAAGVSWAVLRGGLRATDLGRDVDVLVGPGALDRAAAALRSAGWVALPGWKTGTRRSWLGFDPRGPRWPVLDATDGLAFGQTPIRLDAAACLRRSVVGDVRRLAPADAWWVDCLHALLDRGASWPATALDTLRETAASGTGPGAPALAPGDEPRSHSWRADAVVAAAAAGRWDEVAAAVRALDAAPPWSSPRAAGLLRVAVGRGARRVGRIVRGRPRLAIVSEEPARARAVAETIVCALPESVRPAIVTGQRARPAAVTISVDTSVSDQALRAAVASGIWQAIVQVRR